MCVGKATVKYNFFTPLKNTIMGSKCIGAGCYYAGFRPYRPYRPPVSVYNPYTYAYYGPSRLSYCPYYGGYVPLWWRY
jgi:hypothetical protein